MMQWIGKNIFSLIIIGCFIFFGIKTCNRGGLFSGTEQRKPDTVYSQHTEYIQQPPQIIPQYIPIQTGSQQPIIIPSQYKPDTSLNGILKQYIELLNKFLAKNNYLDSVVLKDSAGKRVGVVNLEDQISENRFIYRKPSYQLTFPVTTNTITIMNYEKKRNQFYIGGLLEGSSKNILYSAGAGLLLKTKKDNIWTLNAKYQFQQKAISYELGRYFKLSFRK